MINVKIFTSRASAKNLKTLVNAVTAFHKYGYNMLFQRSRTLWRRNFPFVTLHFPHCRTSSRSQILRPCFVQELFQYLFMSSLCRRHFWSTKVKLEGRCFVLFIVFFHGALFYKTICYIQTVRSTVNDFPTCKTRPHHQQPKSNAETRSHRTFDDRTWW